MAKRKKQTRRKRKSRMELYRARKTPIHDFFSSIRWPAIIRGGNPLGVGEWTLYMASPASVRSSA